MSSRSEVGHAKNVANLQKLIQQVSVYSLYNPPVPNLTVANLQTLYSTAAAKLSEVEDKRNANKNAISLRQVAFKNLKANCTRIINRLEILGLTQGTVNQARSLNRSIQVHKRNLPQHPKKVKKRQKPFPLPDSLSLNKPKTSEFLYSCWQPFLPTLLMKRN